MGQTLSVNRIDDFKSTLDNIDIYSGATYGHEIGMTIKARNSYIIPQIDDPEDNASKSSKYICNI